MVRAFRSRGGWRLAVLPLARGLQLAMLLLVICLAGACDKDGGSQPGWGEIGVQNTLTFLRHDATAMAMGTEYAICCGAWESGYDNRDTFKIWFYHPTFQESFWKLFVLLDEVVVDSLYAFSLEAGPPLTLFLWDASNSNELSSDVERSSGTIIIHSLHRSLPTSISLTIDATIGSEYWDMPSVDVSGTFRATLYGNPAPFGCDFTM